MTWLKVDDGFPSHEKVMALSEGPCRGDAIALWTFGGCWSSHALREGFVPNGVVRAYGFHPEAAPELVRVGLWVEEQGGYRFHDWADYQPSAAQVEERRKAGAERKARSRARLSGAQSEARVGESQRDGGIVTAVPRTESRPCLADASRDRERVSENSSSEQNKNSYPDTAREPPTDQSAIVRRLELRGEALTKWILTDHYRRYHDKHLRPPAGLKRPALGAQLAEWVEGASESYRLSNQALASKILDGLFGSAEARGSLAWAVQDPTEFCGLPPGAPQPVDKPEVKSSPTHEEWSEPEWMRAQ